jgi:hypothetical protein
VRDRHCRWPGCTLRASWCEVHHIRWYSHGGPTSLTNGLTLCTFHHHEIHRRKINIRTIPGGHTFTLPDGTDLGTSQRQPLQARERERAPGASEERATAPRAARTAGAQAEAERQPAHGSPVRPLVRVARRSGNTPAVGPPRNDSAATPPGSSPPGGQDGESVHLW